MVLTAVGYYPAFPQPLFQTESFLPSLTNDHQPKGSIKIKPILSFPWSNTTSQSPPHNLSLATPIPFELTRCDQRNVKLHFYILQYIASRPLKILWTHLAHSLTTFWGSSDSLLKGVSLFALSQLPRTLTPLQTFILHGHFDSGEKPEVVQCQVQWIRWMSSSDILCFHKPSFLLDDIWQQYSPYF